MWSKKFKVRVKHFSSGKYTVEYAHYYFLPNWQPLLFWFEISLTGNTQKWSTNLFSYKQAELVASQLHAIQDIEKYYAPEEVKEKDFYRRKKEYYDKHVPYDTKYFK